MTQTPGQHNPHGERQTPDEDLRALLQCEPGSGHLTQEAQP